MTRDSAGEVADETTEWALPEYDELPEVEGGARSGWGLFGENDNVGLLNLQTRRSVIDAARLIREGKVFTLDLPVDFLGAAIEPGGRGAPHHEVIRRGDTSFDDRLDSFFPQGSTQWDALGHMGFRPGVFYNGVTGDQIAAGERNTIEHWARKGIVGRAVLLDVVRAVEGQGRRIDPFGSYAITVDDLEAARNLGGIRYLPGDVLLVRTGHCEGLAGRDVSERRVHHTQLRTPGLEHSEEMARYLWNTHASAVAADNMALEVWPCGVDLAGDPQGEGWPFGFSHNVLIGLFGLCIGEYFWLKDLAVDCADDGRYEMFFSSAPLNVPGGIGSPPSAVAIK